MTHIPSLLIAVLSFFICLMIDEEMREEMEGKETNGASVEKGRNVTDLI
jgi:hypothetical protein